jgi:hypothetical protein
MEPCRHHGPRPGQADDARLRGPPAVAGIVARLRTCGKLASSAEQRVPHSSEAQSGRRCRTRVEGVEGASAAQNLGTLLTARGGSGLAGLGAGRVCGDRIRRELRGRKSGADTTCASIPQERHQGPGRADTRRRAAVRGQPGRAGLTPLSRWCPRTPASHRDARPGSGRGSAACALACRPAGPGGLAGTARQAASDGSGTVALPRQTQARCPRQAPARGLARFGRRPRGLPRSPPRRQRTTACRAPVVVSELQPRP